MSSVLEVATGIMHCCFPGPRPPKGSKKWNLPIIPLFPQGSNGAHFGGFHFLDP